MANWTYHDGVSTVNSGAFVVSYNVTLPTYSVGDQLFVLIESVAIGSPHPLDTPAGWTIITSVTTGVTAVLTVYGRTADGSEGSAVTFNTSGGNTNFFHAFAFSYTFAGVYTFLTDVPVSSNVTGIQPATTVTSSPDILRVCIWDFQTFAGNSPDAADTTRLYLADAGFGHAMCWTDEDQSGSSMPARTPTVTSTVWGMSFYYSADAAAATTGDIWGWTN